MKQEQQMSNISRANQIHKTLNNYFCSHSAERVQEGPGAGSEGAGLVWGWS